MKNKYLVNIMFVVVLAACGNNENQNNKTQATPPLKADALVLNTKPLDNMIISTGSILANEEVTIKPEISGRVVKISFTEGTVVKKGQLLIKLNDRDLKASLSKIDAQINLANQDESRKKQLLERKAISQEEYDRSSTSLESMLAEREIVKAQIEKTEIYAPFSGKIGLRNISEGASINANTEIVSLIQLDPAKIEFSVPERYASYIKNGTDITFETNDGKSFSAKVYAVEGKVDRASRSYTVRAKCANPSGELIPGSFVKIVIVLEKIENAILVPSGAIVNELSGHKVYVVNNGLARSIDIQTGIRTDSEVQIISGLSVGDTILTTGLLQVRNNTPIVFNKIETMK